MPCYPDKESAANQMYELHETKNCSVRPSASAHSLWGVKGQHTVIHRIREPIYPNQEGGKKGRKEKSQEARKQGRLS